MDDMDVLRVPILIVGGGPVGLSSSLFLARLGIASLLVELHTGVSIHPRARAVTVRTMELLREVDLEEAARGWLCVAEEPIDACRGHPGRD